MLITQDNVKMTLYDVINVFVLRGALWNIQLKKFQNYLKM